MNEQSQQTHEKLLLIAKANLKRDDLAQAHLWVAWIVKKGDNSELAQIRVS